MGFSSYLFGITIGGANPKNQCFPGFFRCDRCPFSLDCQYTFCVKKDQVGENSSHVSSKEKQKELLTNRLRLILRKMSRPDQRQVPSGLIQKKNRIETNLLSLLVFMTPFTHKHSAEWVLIYKNILEYFSCKINSNSKIPSEHCGVSGTPSWAR